MAENIVPPPPQPQRANRSWLRWLLIGDGGCLVLVLIVVIGFAGCVAAISGGSGGDAASPEDEYASAKKKAVPVGETVEVGSVAWTINDVQQSTELKALGEKKEGNFIIVDLTSINNGNEAATLDSESLRILDDQGRAHETGSSNPSLRTW